MKLPLVNRFLVLSFLCILALAVGMGFALSSVVTRAALEWEWENTAAFSLVLLPLVRQVYGREVREATLRVYTGRLEHEATERTRELHKQTERRAGAKYL
jgi:hypothetical protein